MTSKQNKEAAVAALMVTRQKATSLRARLLLQGEAEAAKKVAKRITKLDAKIEALLAKMMKSWASGASTRVGEIKSANKRIQTAIAAMKKKEKRAQQIVKAIGLIDDVIGLAAKFL